MELENKFLGTITLIDSIFNYLKINWAPYQVGGWGRPGLGDFVYFEIRSLNM